MDLIELERATNLTRNIVQILAVILGGLWAYLKFVRGRTFRRRGELDVSSRLYTFDDEPALAVKITFKNTGLSRIIMSNELPPRVIVTRLETSGWQEGAVTWVPINFTEPTPEEGGGNSIKGEGPPISADLVKSTATMLAHHHWIEPGETVADEQIVVPPGEGETEFAVAYRIQATLATTEGWLRRRPILWTAYAIVPGMWLTEAASPSVDNRPQIK